MAYAPIMSRTKFPTPRTVKACLHEAISSDELDSSDVITTKSLRVNMKSVNFLWPTRWLREIEHVLFCCDIARLIRRSDQSNRR